MIAEVLPQALAVVLWPLAVLAVCAVVGIALRVWLDRALARIAPGRAVPWDGVGPERECLVRLSCGALAFWEHVQWFRGEGANPDEYVHRFSRDRTAAKFEGAYRCDGPWRITHYAEPPEVTP